MDKFSQALRSAKAQTIIVSALLFVIGLLLVIFPNHALNLFCYIAGAALILFGVYRLIIYVLELKNNKFSLALLSAAVLIAFGLLLVINPGIVTGMLTVLFGIIIIIEAVSNLQDAVNRYIAKEKGWWLQLVVAVITLPFGIVILVNPFTSTEIIMIFAGISLMLEAVITLLCAFFMPANVTAVQPADPKDNVTDI